MSQLVPFCYLFKYFVHIQFAGILFYCISPTQRHAKCLEIAVLNGAEPNNTDKQGIPVLLHACETAMDNEEMCMLLIQKGAEPNSKQEVINIKSTKFCDANLFVTTTRMNLILVA